MINPVGRLGEDIATEYLLKKNYSLLDRNFRTRMGEIDIICQKDDKLVFVEVKTRVGVVKGKPYEAVNARKLAHLKKAVYYYLMLHGGHESKMRLDVVSVILGPDRSVVDLKHFENVQLD